MDDLPRIAAELHRRYVYALILSRDGLRFTFYIGETGDSLKEWGTINMRSSRLRPTSGSEKRFAT